MLVLHQGLEAGDSVKSSSARMALSSSVRPGGGIGGNLAAHATRTRCGQLFGQLFDQLFVMVRNRFAGEVAPGYSGECLL
jgi:hypothetical protein